MPHAEDIAAQQELLATYRRTLHHFLKQRALAGEMLIPPNVTHGIDEARRNIRQIKSNLRSWGVPVDDLPIDEEFEEPPSDKETFLSKNQSSKSRQFPTNAWVVVIGLVGVIIIGILSVPALLSTLQRSSTSTRDAPAALSSTLPLQATVPSVPSSSPQSLQTDIGRTPAPPNDTCPVRLDFGALIQCEIAQQGELHIHRVAAAQDDLLLVDIMKVGTGNPFTLHATIADPKNQVLYDPLEDRFISRIFRATSSGEYTIRVEDQDRTNTGTYAIYVQRLNNPVNARHLTVGASLSGSIKSPRQHDVYTFDALAGNQISIEIAQIPATGPLTLRAIVYRPDGKEEFANHSEITVPLDFTATVTGTYVIVLYDIFLSNTGSYRIVRMR